MKTINTTLIIFVVMISIPSQIQAAWDDNNCEYKICRIFASEGNDTQNPWYTYQPKDSSLYMKGFQVQVAVTAVAYDPDPVPSFIGYVYVVVNYCSLGMYYSNTPVANCVGPLEIGPMMRSLRTSAEYANMDEQHRSVYTMITEAYEEITDKGLSAYNSQWSYEYLYQSNCYSACALMDVVYAYWEKQTVRVDGGEISIDSANIEVTIDKDIMKQAITEALEGLGNYYVPPEMELPDRSTPELYPTWTYDIPSLVLSPPSLSSIGNDSMGGSIEIPVLGQTYSFDWSSQLTGLAVNLDPYRQAFRYMLLAIVTMAALFLVWKTLRQY